jgi:hypothetical protein
VDHGRFVLSGQHDTAASKSVTVSDFVSQRRQAEQALEENLAFFCVEIAIHLV